MALLQEDPSDATQNILLVISQQLANNSIPAFDANAHPFTPPTWAVRVNDCFFISLCCSLATAMAAVLALQWVGSYDRGLDQSSVENRALQRHFRAQGARKYKFKHFISALSSVIFVSLLIFMIGLAEWLWNVHRGIGVIIVVGTTLGACFYAITTLISLIDIAAPFQTPISRLILMWTSLMLNLFKRDEGSPRWTTTAINRVKAIPQLLLKIRHFSLLKFFKQVFKYRSILESYENREQEAIKAAKEDIQISGLCWFAKSTSVGPRQRQAFVTTVQAILDLPQQKRRKDQIDAVPWKDIFLELYTPYINKADWREYSSEDLQGAVLLLRAMTFIGLESLEKDFDGLFECFYGRWSDMKGMRETLESWRQLELDLEEQRAQKSEVEDKKESTANIEGKDGNTTDSSIALVRQDVEPVEGEWAMISYTSSPEIQRAVMSSYKHALRSWAQCPPEYTITILQGIRDNSSMVASIKSSDLFEPFKDYPHVELNGLTTVNPVPLQVLDLIMEIITMRLSQPPFRPFDLSHYLGLIEDPSRRDLALPAHKVIVEQTFARLAQLNETDISNGPRVRNILLRIYQLVDSSLWEQISDAMTPLLLRALVETKINIWDTQNRPQTAKIMGLILANRYKFEDNWVEWWVQIILGFASFITPPERNISPVITVHETDISIVVKHVHLMMKANLPGRSEFNDVHIARLGEIKQPGILLLAATLTHSADIANSLLKIETNWVLERPWTDLVEHCYQYLGQNGQIDMPFIRAFTVLGSWDLYDKLYLHHVKHITKVTSLLIYNIECRQAHFPFQGAPEMMKYLSFPVLKTMFEVCPMQEKRILNSFNLAAKDEKFSDEFEKAGGFTWLSTFTAGAPSRLEYSLSIIIRALCRSKTFHHSMEWLDCTYNCLVQVGKNVKEGKLDATDVQQLARKNANLLAAEIRRKSTSRKKKDVAEAVVYPMTPVTPSIAGFGNMIPPPEAGRKAENIPNQGEEWSTEEWKSWNALADDILPGLKRCYIDPPAEV